MHLKQNILIWTVLLAILTACSTGSKIESARQTAEQAFENGNYAVALTAYEKVIAEYKAEGRTAECPVYGKAGRAAMETGDVDKALDYLQMDTYTPYVSAETYRSQARGYRKIDNLSKEIMALEDYLEKYPEGEDVGHIKNRLFETYVESENWEKATGLWPELPEESKRREDMLEKWFEVNLELENRQASEKLADELLQLNPNHVKALEYNAEKAYNKAEDHYQREMKAYEENRTNRQYKRLLEELDKITEEFQVALGYYEKLWDLDPKPKYARYMSNIYARFNDKEKADYYRKKAGD